MKNKKYGFTLIEMVIVISIMTLMLGLSMNFGAKRIVELKYQTIKEKFTSDFTNIYSDCLTSNYYNQKRYDFLQMTFSSGANIRNYDYLDSNNNLLFSETGHIENMFLSNILVDRVSHNNGEIKIKPYSLGCEIFTTENDKILTGSVLEFLLIANDKSKKYCFEINGNNCKIAEIGCK